MRAEVLLDDVRDYAARLNDKEQGMERMRTKFRDMGGRLYVPADEAAADER